MPNALRSLPQGSLQTGDDNYLYAEWVKTEGFAKTIEKVKTAIRIMLQGNSRTVCIVAHDEICRLILCLCQGINPKNFADDSVKVKRGEFVTLTKSPKETGYFKRS